MKAKNLYLCTIMAVSVLMLIGIVSAKPGVPHQFYGSVTMDGSPASDGTRVSALIGGDTYATTTVDGTYNLIVRDPDGNRKGKTVEFFVIYVKAGEAKFENGNNTELNLGFTSTCDDEVCTGSEDCSSCPQDCGTCPAPPGGGGPVGGGYIPPCYEDWSCTSWSPLVCPESEIQTRTCIDANNCGTEKEKPVEERTCTYTPLQLPAICNPGVRVCAGNDLMQCFEGNNWIKVETCEYGCSDNECNPAPAPTVEGNITGPTVGMPTGLVFGVEPGLLAGIIGIIIVLTGGMVYWSRRR